MSAEDDIRFGIILIMLGMVYGHTMDQLFVQWSIVALAVLIAFLTVRRFMSDARAFREEAGL